MAKGNSSPSAAEVDAALQRVLGSRTFDRAGRSSAFLRFIVEEALRGRGDRLKGFTIAVEVFGRAEDFDAQADPLVRVEAGRLRRRLVEYYGDEGRDDPVRIDLPRGAYLPSFASRGGTLSADEPDDEAPPDARAGGKQPERAGIARAFLSSGGAVAVLGSLAVVGILAAAGWFVWDSGHDATVDDTETAAALATPPVLETPASAATSGTRAPRMIVLPIANISNDASFDAFAAGLTEEIIRALVQFDIITTASPTAGPLDPVGLESLREQFDARYALTGSVRTTNEGIRVAARLMDTEAGTQLWTRNFDAATAEGSLQAEESIARIIVLLISSPFGPVFSDEIERIADRSADQLDPYECLLRFYGYARTFGRRLHADSVFCMQRAVLSEPGYASGWSALATLYLHEHTFGYTPQPDRGPPLERALEAVRRALDIDGGNLVAAVNMIGIQFALGDDEAFERAVERALAIRPVHPAVLGNVGYSLALSGQLERGLPLLDQAIPETADVPGWYYVPYAFRDLLAGNYDSALDWALRIDAPEWFATPMTVAASAAYAGRLELAQREVARLLELYPEFERTGRQRLALWAIDADIRETLIEGLRLAGMEIS